MTLHPLAVTNADLLEAIDAGAYTSSADLAEAAGIDAGNLSRKLASLIDALWVFRDNGAATYDVTLTEGGRDQLAAIRRANAPASATSGDAPEGFVWLTHAQIRPDPNNARKVFDEDELAGLADSIADKGLLQKPAVRPAAEDGSHTLVAGERRLRAWGLLIARGDWLAEHRELCPIFTADTAQAEEAGIIENLQRSDLSPLEEANGFKGLIERHGHTPQTIAPAVRRTDRFVQQRLQLLQLKPADMKALADGDIGIEEARKRIAAYPKPIELTAAERLIFLEVAHRAACRGKDIYERMPVSHTVDREACANLERLGLLIIGSTTDAGEVDIALGGKAPAALIQFTGQDAPEIDSVGWALQAADPDANRVLGDDDYETPWLNAPYTIDEDLVATTKAAREKGEADLAASKAEADKRAEERRAEQAAASERGKAMLDQARGLYIQATQQVPDENIRAKARGLLEHFGMPAPWRVEPFQQWVGAEWQYRIVDGNGAPNEASTPEEMSARRLLLVMGLNALAGYPLDSIVPPVLPSEVDATLAPPVDEDDETLPESLMRLAGVRGGQDSIAAFDAGAAEPFETEEAQP